MPIARGVILAEAAVIAAPGIGAGHWMLLLVAALLAWQGWMETALAAADDMIGRYLGTRRLGAVARDFSTTSSAEELLSAAMRRRADNKVIAVEDGHRVTGAIGPRQAAPGPASARSVRCADAMVSLGQLELLRSEAPAVTALAQLDRFGFAVVLDRGGLRYVEVSDLLQRILLTASVAQSVRSSTHAGFRCSGMDATIASAIPPVGTRSWRTRHAGPGPLRHVDKPIRRA